ncbi:hypothetical protein JF781_20580 [Mycobacterium sp. WUMAC-067]|uniref:hypothetical protein n=1 Tax=unclassified Mycobacterium TaxID=2642494 RepID=UPI001E10F43E|nr:MULTISPECIES: hypothetical protein [unclassified Mycobacterium]MCA2244759.1 hypothetical protein [Mycobacterium sp. WUMAC-067]MCA2316337.1 hypothetical protein [Mycobacterium sp. WUMAC-025]
MLVLVIAGVSAWLYLRPSPRSDCTTVNDMLKYSRSENARMRDLIPASIDDPQKLVDAYQARETRLRQYADQIHDPGLREKAYALVNLDDKMLAVWRQTIPGQSQQGSDSSSASQNFQRAYTDYAAQTRQAGQALQAACPA